ncbi:unnamed protein product [Amoebophrya sp. A120]|nr:unnamed protein product [Amoebophrya sp. A120]|eukprot:GSA120T00021354001.1
MLGHGRKKEQQSEEQLLEERKMVQKGRELFNIVLSRNLPVEKMLEVTKKAVMLHPEFGTLWNIRRETLYKLEFGTLWNIRRETFYKLEKMASSATSSDKKGQEGTTTPSSDNLRSPTKAEIDSGSEPHQPQNVKPPSVIVEALNNELLLLDKAMQQGRKCYCLWTHRRWVVDEILKRKTAEKMELPGEEQNIDLILAEKKKIRQFFQLDARNFHAWNYRQWLLEKEEVYLYTRSLTGEDSAQKSANHDGTKSHDEQQKEEDLALSEELILENFSNYSAWYLRGKVVASGFDFDLESELEWLQQAIFTEPNDQSIWFYHEFLLLKNREMQVLHCEVFPNNKAAMLSDCAKSGAARRTLFSCCLLCSDSLSKEDFEERFLPPELLVGKDGGGSFAEIKVIDVRAARVVEAAMENMQAADHPLTKPGPPGEEKQDESLDYVFCVDLEFTSVVDSGTETTQLAEQQVRNLFQTTSSSAESSREIKPQQSKFFARNVSSQIVQTEIERIDELLELEPDCYLAVLAKARLLEALWEEKNCKSSAQLQAEPATSEKGRQSGPPNISTEDVASLYRKLASELDPMRRGYYLDQIKRVESSFGSRSVDKSEHQTMRTATEERFQRIAALLKTESSGAPS